MGLDLLLGLYFSLGVDLSLGACERASMRACERRGCGRAGVRARGRAGVPACMQACLLLPGPGWWPKWLVASASVAAPCPALAANHLAFCCSSLLDSKKRWERAGVRACERARVRACGRVGLRACVRACGRVFSCPERVCQRARVVSVRASVAILAQVWKGRRLGWASSQA